MVGKIRYSILTQVSNLEIFSNPIPNIFKLETKSLFISKPKLDQALQGNHLVKMTVFEPTKPCKNSQSSLYSKGFEFISKSIQKNGIRKRKGILKRKRPRGRVLAQQQIEPSKPTRGPSFSSLTRKHTQTDADSQAPLPLRAPR
jgi:hypothetical protein